MTVLRLPGAQLRWTVVTETEPGLPAGLHAPELTKPLRDSPFSPCPYPRGAPEWA